MRFKTFYKPCSLLVCGALGGHMAHPYEVLSPTELLQFFDDLVGGQLESSEKVDGVNIFIGLQSGQVVFARNRTEAPSADIESKFPLTHPASDSFRAGFLAISNAFQALSPAQQKKFLLHKYFINCEILYGEVPNLIQYSDITNYIVFHSYHFGPTKDFERADVENSADLLTALASTIGEQTVSTEVVSYVGEPGNVKQVTEEKDSKWTFRGPIKISPEKVKANLQAVAAKWKSMPEVKQLQKHKSLSSDQIASLMKSLSLKIGSKVLTSLTSELLTGSKKTSSDHPGLEGLVLKFKDKQLKITGDFAELNQKLWGPLRGSLDMTMRDLVSTILEAVGVGGISSILKSSWGTGAEDFLRKKAPKRYKDPAEFKRLVDVNTLRQKVKSTIATLAQHYNNMSNQKNNIKQDAILKALRIASYRLQQLDAQLTKSRNVTQVTTALAQTMFGL